MNNADSPAQNVVVSLDGEAVDFEEVECKLTNKQFPEPALDIVLTLKNGIKIYDDGNRVMITHRNTAKAKELNK